MTTVTDIFTHLNTIAPVAMKMDFDNVGHLVGRGDAEVRRVLVALDITDAVIDEAIELGAQLIVSHHPIILNPLRQVTDADLTGRQILKLVRHDIAAICMHTNLDAAEGGINDVLAERLGLCDTEILWQLGELDGVPYGLGRIGTLSAPADMAVFLPRVQAAVGSAGLRYHDAGRPVYKVASMGGSGGDLVSAAMAAGCDTYVIGEAKYHAFLEARELGINLIEADHYCTEDVISVPLRDTIRAAFPEVAVTVSARHDQVVRFYEAGGVNG
ncbi:MAG: Nif3-like dinuclear metal center hexameric protein [Oscillospiraceae bacterium]|nr:Nif3-like dinuclear metal center hexameric protein [Oscillospiraceae bacterium]